MRQANSLFTSVVDNLKSKLPIGNPASAQGVNSRPPNYKSSALSARSCCPQPRHFVVSLYSIMGIPDFRYKTSNLNRYRESGFHKHKFHDSGTVHNNEGISRVVFTRSEDIIGITMSKCPLLNYLIIGKLYLSDCRKKQVLPNIEGFKFKVRIKYQVEKYISTKNNKLETFYEKWPKDI